MSALQYAVIKFISDESYSEIPVAWLTGDEQFCYWPRSSRNLYSMMMKGIPPDPKTWDKYAINLEGKYGTLQQARRKAEDSDYLSTTTDEEKLGKGRRKKMKSRKTRSLTTSPTTSVSRSEEDDDPLEVPTPPQLMKRTSLNKDQIVEISDPATIHSRTNYTFDNIDPFKDEDVTIVNINPVDICEAASIGAPNTSDTPKSISSVNSVILEKINNLCTTMHIQMLAIESRIGKLENSGQFERYTKDDATFKKCMEYLPLTDVPSMQAFDTLLKDDVVMGTKYVQYISNIGGRHTKDIIHRILRKPLPMNWGFIARGLGNATM